MADGGSEDEAWEGLRGRTGVFDAVRSSFHRRRACERDFARRTMDFHSDPVGERKGRGKRWESMSG